MVFHRRCIALVCVCAAFIGPAGPAAAVDLAPTDERIVCWGTEPFWWLEHFEGQSTWRSYDAMGETDLAMEGRAGMAGAAYGPITLWQGAAPDGSGDFVVVAEPADIPVSEADDFVPTHEAWAATPDGRLFRGQCAIPAVEVGW